MAFLAFTGGMYFAISEVLLPRIRALTESTHVMPTDTAFNATGYDDGSGTVAVLSTEVRIATSSAWFNASWLKKKTVTVNNLSGSDLEASSSASISVDTSELYDASSLQADCDDLRIVHIATESGNLRTEIPRAYTKASGATDCSDSVATIVTFPLQEKIWTGQSTTNYEVYYDNASAETAAHLGGNGYDITRSDGSTASATLVCPFNQSTTCIDGETPSTETGAIRYSGGKSAMSFDGSADTIVVPTSSIPTSSEVFTFEFWIKPEVHGDENDIITGSNLKLALYGWTFGSSSDYAGDLISVGSCSWNQATIDRWQRGEWQHFAIVFDGTNLSLYKDGSVVKTVVGSCGFTPSGTYRIANTSDWRNYTGLIDEVRFSNVARYTSNFTAPTAPFQPDSNTLLLYHFDENGDDPRNSGKVIDASGNANHGTITGAKYVSGLVGVDASTSDTGNVSSQSYAAHQGVFIEEGTTNLITNPSFDHATWNTNWALPYMNYDSTADTFTAKMAKRNGSASGPFAAGVMVGGDVPGGDGQADQLRVSPGTQVSGNFYDNIDTNQGSMVLFWTPEFSSADHSAGTPYLFRMKNDTQLLYSYINNRFQLTFGDAGLNVSQAITAGTTYTITARWDFDNTLDGTNYVSLSINDTHSYGNPTGESSPDTPGNYAVGEENTATNNPANGLIEGLTIYRRPLYDGTYGIDAGNGDEIAQIYNSGTGKDPTLVTGSWDVVFALPTNASTGELSTGTGEAWSHPHSSNLLGGTNGKDGFMMDGTYTNDGWVVEEPLTLEDTATASATFTEGLAKRNGGGPFAAAPMFQGNWDGTGTMDMINSDLLSTIAPKFTNLVDANQGTVSFFWTPERSTDATYTQNDFLLLISAMQMWVYYEHDNSQIRFLVGNQTIQRPLTITAGTTYSIVLRWDTKNTLDGTNYQSISVSDAHSFGGANAPSVSAPTFVKPGHYSSGFGGANGIIEGLTIYRRPLYDGTYGVDVGNGDEIAQIYNSGSFQDPTLVTGSWDVVFALPTDADASEAMVTGEGEAWSHPHSSNILTDGFGQTAYGSSGWSDQGSPVVPYSVEFDGMTTEIGVGSDSSLDNLPAGAMTVEVWARGNSKDNFGSLIGKATSGTGWFWNTSSSGFVPTIYYSGGSITVGGATSTRYDNKWHHHAITFDAGGDKKLRYYIDGVLFATSTAASGSNTDDSALNTTIGGGFGGKHKGGIGWVRISNSIRYTDTFVPPSRLDPPATDGNTKAQYNFRDGTGTTLTDAVGVNNGTISNGTWNTVADMSTDAPGERVYNWGYTVGSDMADEGIKQTKSGLTAGQNYVVRPVISYEADRRAQPYVQIWDETNNEQITKFDLPWLYGQHSGGDGASALSNSSAPYWPTSLVGGTVYNITDGSSITISVAGDSIAGSLTGGTDNDWDNNDYFMIVPPSEWVFAEPFTFELPTNARNGSTSDSTAMNVRVLSDASDGVFYLHQIEVLENLVDNPSLETGSSDPWDPDGWGYISLEAGESQSSSTGNGVIHSGSDAIQYNSTTDGGERLHTNTLFTTTSAFYSSGGWGYAGSYPNNMQLRPAGGGRTYLTDGRDAGVVSKNFTNSTWTHEAEVVRRGPDSSDSGLEINVGGNGTTERYVDDLYTFELDPVSLTVTPASEANSAEGLGLRVDGADTATQTVDSWAVDKGFARFKFTPRHSFATADLFGVTSPVIAHYYYDADNYIKLYRHDDSTLRLTGVFNGTTVNADYSSPTLNAGTEYSFVIKYTSGGNLTLDVDGTEQASQSGVVDFGTVPNIVYYGTDNGGANSNPYDGVYLDPDALGITVAANDTTEKVFAGGYKVTSDLPDEGLYQDITVSAGDDWVIRALGHSDGTSIPKVILYDQTNGAEIGSLTATSSASTRSDPEVFIFTGEAPTDSTTLRVKLLNTQSSGTTYWHQAEVYDNLITNPSLEGGSGDAYIPTGWSNVSLDAGDTEVETTTTHSGDSSIQYNAGAESNESFRTSPTLASGKFSSLGGWSYGSGSVGNKLIGESGQWALQATSATAPSLTDATASWNQLQSVVRRTGAAGMTMFLYGNGAGPIYFDDVYMVTMDDVSLTVTPATEENSGEDSGLRVDGADTLTQTVSGLSASSGKIKFEFTPRHDFDDADKFGTTTPYIFRANYDGSNALFLYKSSTTLAARGYFNGTDVRADWTDVTLNAGTTYSIEVSYTSGGNLVLTVDGVERASQSGVVAFGNTPTTVYFGTNNSGANQYDGTITNFTALTPTENTTAPYYKFGSKSAKLVNSGSLGDEYVIAIDPDSTATHTLSTYVYDGTSGNVGGTVDATVAKLVFGGSTVTPNSFTDMGGGWWRAVYSAATSDASLNYGVQALAGKTIYVDGVQLEAKAYATTYADGTLGDGYSWGGTAHESSGVRATTNNYYSSNTGLSGTTVSTSSWVYLPYLANADSHNLLFLRNSSGSTALGANIYNGTLRVVFYDSGGSYKWCNSTTTPSVGQWAHIMISSENGSNKIYVNGVDTTPGSCSGSGTGVIRDITDGKVIFSNSNAILSDLRIYDSALTADEVADLYYQGLSTHSEGDESDDRFGASGTYTSPVLDLGANGQWGGTPISFTDVANGGTIAYSTRSSADNSTWSDWEAVSGSTIASDPRRYFQWKALMTAPDTLAGSPVITGMNLAYVQDSTAPSNPDSVALGWSTAATESADLTSGSWYNYATPKFTWEEGEDPAEAGQSASGIDGYYTLLTTDNEATPSASTGDDCYAWLESDDREFVVGTDAESCELSNGTYYLRLETKDNSGNKATPATLFTYKYDGTNPEPPASVSSTTIGYSATNEFTFFWPAGSDTGGSSVAGYQYKTGASSGEFSDWQFTDGVQISGVTPYTEGQNVFYVRTKDGAGNVSTTTASSGTVSFYYNSTAPTAPSNLAVSPATTTESPADTNSFTLTWDKPASYSGEIAKYHYCVNCTPSASTMTETTATQTVDETIINTALATQQGKNTFYIVAEDNNINATTGVGNRNFEAYSEVDFYATTTAPGAPTNLTVSDASDRDSEKWRLTLAWDAASTGSTPDHYEVHRSTDNSTFTKVGEVNGTAYTDGSLTQSTTYYYKIKAIDNAGASSLYSATVTKAPEGKYNSPPPAGGVPSAAVGSTTTTITWSTTRNAFGAVEFGKTSSYGSAASETTAASSHSVKLTGLAPGTSYHYRTQNLDDSDLVGYERSDAYSADYTFTTLNGAEISEVQVDEVGLDSAVISWVTTSLATSKVEYGTTTGYGAEKEVSTTADESTHTTRISNLDHSATYHFRVSGTTADGDDINSDDYTFNTVTFPKVTAVVFNTDQAGNGTTATIAYSTNVPTTGEVEYQRVEVDPKYADTDAGRDLFTTNTAGTGVDLAKLKELSQTQLSSLPIIPVGTSQSVYSGQLLKRRIQKVTGMEDGSIYIFTIRGRDEHGNEAISDPIRYVTGSDTRAPLITNLVIETPLIGMGIEAKAQAIISFETDEPANSQIIWGSGIGSEYPNSTEQVEGLTTRHVIVLRDLNPTSSYHLKIKATDEVGNTTESEDTVIVTPTAQDAAFDIILKNLEDVFGFLKLL